VKATNINIAIEKYLISRTPFLKEENLQFFEDTKNGPTTITLLPLNHLIDSRCDFDY